MTQKPPAVTYHTFENGARLKIVRDRNATGSQPIITNYELSLYPWSLEAVGVLLTEYQKHADETKRSFRQTLNLPGGPDLRFAFAPDVPWKQMLPESAPFDPEQARVEILAALAKRLIPEVLAASLASLPPENRRRIASKYLAKPPVRFITRKPRPKKP